MQNLSTPPGRVANFLKGDNPNLKPFSCVFRKYKNDLFELINLLAYDLCGGAGVKVNLDNFKKFEPKKNRPDWGFYLNPNHPDIKFLNSEQKKLFRNLSEEATVIKPLDSMRDSGGIQDSWREFIYHYENSNGGLIIVDLSNLRPAGTINGKGLEASGAVGRNRRGETSFLSIYAAIANHLDSGSIDTLLVLLGTINDTLRRGGFKRGIICTSLDYRNDNIYDYLKFNNASCPGNHKKSVRLDKGILKEPLLLELVAESAEKESTFLEKIKPNRPDLYANVCVGIALTDGGLCTIWRINLAGISDYNQIVPAFEVATADLLNLFLTWRESFKKEDLSHLPPIEKDKQVGLDVLGLASLLANFRVSYSEFTKALHDFNNNADAYYEKADKPAYKLVTELARGYQSSSILADNLCLAYGVEPLERIHTIEPSQRHFTECKDSLGYTATRCIFPPFERTQRRVSDHEKQAIYYHNPEIEIASEVGAENVFNFACEFKTFLDNVGRPHGYMSFDSLEEITPNWIRKFLDSPLESKYYSESSRFDQSFMKKDSAVCELGRVDECLVCSE